MELLQDCCDPECCGQEILNSICRIYVAEISAAICNNEMLFCQNERDCSAAARHSEPTSGFHKNGFLLVWGLSGIRRKRLERP